MLTELLTGQCPVNSTRQRMKGSKDGERDGKSRKAMVQDTTF